MEDLLLTERLINTMCTGTCDLSPLQKSSFTFRGTTFPCSASRELEEEFPNARRNTFRVSTVSKLSRL